MMLETPIPVTNDESGFIFIGRSPKHFEKILNFLRDCYVELPESAEDVAEIQMEAQYYMLDGLVRMCEKRNQKLVELEYPDKLRFIKSDEELFELTYRPEKPVLVFFAPKHLDGNFRCPSNFDFIEFQKKYASKIEIYIKLQPISEEFSDNWHYRSYKRYRENAGFELD
ncbi:unnamed protein product [Caenorhabditis nigoni]